MKRVPRSGQHRTIAQVWAWYEIERRILAEEQARVRGDLATAAASPNSPYYGLTSEETEQVFLRSQEELDFLTMLDLMTAAEAAIRLDFLDRSEGRWKDAISRRFSAIHKENAARRRKHWRIGLDESILQTWRELEPETKGPVGKFRAVLNLRHWLAHGRDWVLKPARAHTPKDVYDISVSLLQSLDI
jgi:hypothetical protein